MKSDFSTKWKASKQPRKQRKYAYNAPVHIRGKFLTAPVAKNLAEKHLIKRLRVIEGDKVKILLGKFKGKEGKIESVNLSSSKVVISGIEISKKDGSKSRPSFHASNLIITDLNLNDKKRISKKTDKKTDKSTKKDQPKKTE